MIVLGLSLLLFAEPPAPSPSVPSEAALRRQASVDLSPPKRRKGLYKPPGSKQRALIEIKLGPYSPDVDLNYDGPGFGPFASLFGPTNDVGQAVGEPRWQIMPVLGGEWQFFYAAGRLALGAQVSFYRTKAYALLEQVPISGSVRSAADEIRFGFVPIAVQFIYRFEMPADRWGVPIVPYGKIGPAYAFWWSTDGSRNISRNSQGDKGRGGTWGWQVNLGVMLRLDSIEPNMARVVDNTTGLNHTYLYGEYQISRINNFGVGSAMSLGDNTWFAGLAVEF